VFPQTVVPDVARPIFALFFFSIANQQNKHMQGLQGAVGGSARSL
jgi:hypothetical protein